MTILNKQGTMSRETTEDRLSKRFPNQTIEQKVRLDWFKRVSTEFKEILTNMKSSHSFSSLSLQSSNAIAKLEQVRLHKETNTHLNDISNTLREIADIYGNENKES